MRNGRAYICVWRTFSSINLFGWAEKGESRPSGYVLLFCYSVHRRKGFLFKMMLAKPNTMKKKTKKKRVPILQADLIRNGIKMTRIDLSVGIRLVWHCTILYNNNSSFCILWEQNT